MDDDAPPKTRTKKKVGRKSFSIKEICERNHIGRSTYYKLKEDGLGPKEVRIGRSVRVTREAEDEWLKELEE
jgi:excisionase family DNA binding protein